MIMDFFVTPLQVPRFVFCMFIRKFAYNSTTTKDCHMNFRLYDILAMLVQGILVTGTALFLFYPDCLNGANSLYLTAVAFFIGYIINALGSWLEEFYRWLVGGKPSTTIFHPKKGKNYSGSGRVRFYQVDIVSQLLCKDCNVDEVKGNEEILFSHAKNIAEKSDNKRIHEFNATYAMSRSFLTAAIILMFLIIVRYPCCWYSYLSIIIVVVCLFRFRDCNYYYVREVLTTYLHQRGK